MASGRMGTSWDLVIYNPVLGSEVVTDDSDDVDVSYVLTQNGGSAGTGDLEYEAYGYENAWAARITLPEARGILTAVVTASATVDAETLVGERQVSIEVR